MKYIIKHRKRNNSMISSILYSDLKSKVGTVQKTALTTPSVGNIFK